MQKNVLVDTKILKTYTATFFKTFDVSLFNVKKTLDKKKLTMCYTKLITFLEIFLSSKLTNFSKNLLTV